MSRASDITLFLIIIQASIGFIVSTELFNYNYSTILNQYNYKVTNLSDFEKNIRMFLDIDNNYLVLLFLVNIHS